MADFRMDPITGDLDITDGDAVLITGVDAIAQDLTRRLRAFLGEWFADPEGVGVPYLQEVLGKGRSLAAIRQVFRDQILGTPGVLSIETMDLDFDEPTRVLTVTFQGTTTDGPIDFSATTEIQ